MIDPDQVYRRYQEFQSYVGWTEEDAQRVQSLAPLLEPYLPALVEDFYAEIARHPEAHKVFGGGQTQIDRLKGSLLAWLRELLTGPYDREYVVRRWRVGARHVEIGLDQVYPTLALSRIRAGLVRALGESWAGDRRDLAAAVVSLNRLLDLDLAKIEHSYQAEHFARLQRSERLANLGQIAGGVAHELRNPLNVISTSLYYLNSASAARTEKEAEHMRRMVRNVELANDAITALSNFARMPSPEARPFSLEQCVRDALEDSGLPDGIEVVVSCRPDLPPPLADRDQIRIVLSNLIRNARDAMPEGGRLSIVGRSVENGLEVDVTDTGVGIASGDLVRIMEPLYSTKARGLGLGLPLVRMILEKNRGSLQVVSELGRGSTFRVLLAAEERAGDSTG